MKDATRYVYLYDHERKLESFGQLKKGYKYCGTQDDQDEVFEMVRTMISDTSETFYLINIESQKPFGSVLSDVISVDFKMIDENLADTTWEGDKLVELFNLLGLTQLPAVMQKIIHPLNRKKNPDSQKHLENIKTEMEKNIRFLRAIKTFVELCIEYPQLYTLGQFRRFLNITRMDKQFPVSLGFFSSIKDFPAEQYLMTFGQNALAQSPTDYYCEDQANLKRAMTRALPYDKNIGYSSEATVEAFEISGTVDALLISLFHLIQNQTVIKKCGNCGKFFVPLLRSDAIYCDRPAPQDTGRTCKDYGSRVLWYENVVNDEVLKLARNIYYAKKMLAQRNPDRSDYAEMFEYYKVERKKWEAGLKAGSKTREEFLAWLKQMKMQKTLQERS